MSYMNIYSSVIMQPYLGKTEYWRHMLDDIDEAIWRPYMFTKPWVEDDEKMVYFFGLRYLLGRVPGVIEILFQVGDEIVWSATGHAIGVNTLCSGIVKESNVGADFGVRGFLGGLLVDERHIIAMGTTGWSD